MSELACTFEQFKRMALEFHEAAPTLDRDQLENAWKCLGLGYLNMSEQMWQHSAATLLTMESRTYIGRLTELATLAKGTPEAQAEEHAAMARDARRFRALAALAKEELLRPARASCEMLPDLRTHWKLPTLMCSGPVGGFQTFEEAVDALMPEDAQP